MAQLMSLPLTVSCFSKILIGFTFLVPAHPGSHGQNPEQLYCCEMVVVAVLVEKKGKSSKAFSASYLLQYLQSHCLVACKCNAIK